jgi:hypothetical protein
LDVLDYNRETPWDLTTPFMQGNVPELNPNNA